MLGRECRREGTAWQGRRPAALARSDGDVAAGLVRGRAHAPGTGAEDLGHAGDAAPAAHFWKQENP